MIHLQELDEFTDKYATLDMQPLMVTAYLRSGGRLVAFEPPVYLDGLLARCVVFEATRGRGVADEPNDGYWIPLPLRMVWQSEKGFPLWDSSVFFPLEAAVEDVFYQHKRMNHGIASDTRKIRTVVGRWMERRTPYPIKVCSAWRAYCVGNADAISDLLEIVAFLGKRRAIGFGEIDEWVVSPADSDITVVKDGALAHAIPYSAATTLSLRLGTQPVTVGWTPPYWKAALHLPGWPVGTSL